MQKDHSCRHDEKHEEGHGHKLTEAQKTENRKAFAEKVKLQIGASSAVSSIPKRIAIWSAKGGVGKTTIAILLAKTIATHMPTGILDADIDCPNVLEALGIQERLKAKGGKMVPIQKGNLSIISMAGITSEPVVWRGPMISNAISQFMGKSHWEVKTLIIDMPPGTSDAAITVAEIIRPTGYIIVTTSQKLALMDAKKTIQFLQKSRLPILGIVENMSGEVFGKGGTKELANLMGIRFLGSVPLNKKMQTISELPHETKTAELFENIIKKFV